MNIPFVDLKSQYASIKVLEKYWQDFPNIYMQFRLIQICPRRMDK